MGGAGLKKYVSSSSSLRSPVTSTIHLIILQVRQKVVGRPDHSSMNVRDQRDDGLDTHYDFVCIVRASNYQIR